MSEVVRELKKIDTEIEDELVRSRERTTLLLKQREDLVREACVPPEDGIAEKIMELATRRAPLSFTMTDAYDFAKSELGPSVKPSHVTAWLSKLKKKNKLKRLKRGVYALA